MAINLSSSIWEILIKANTHLDDDSNNSYTYIALMMCPTLIFIYTNSFNSHNTPVMSLQKKKLRDKELKESALIHIASKWQSQDSTPCSQDPESMLLMPLSKIHIPPHHSEEGPSRRDDPWLEGHNIFWLAPEGNPWTPPQGWMESTLEQKAYEGSRTLLGIF